MAQQSPTLPQQQQQTAQRFSPYPSVQSPASATSTSAIALPGPPPAKRQRLSPNPPSYTNSPYATSPTNPHLSLPGTPGSSTPTFHQPPPHPLHNQLQEAAQRTAPGSMGPPQRPVDRLERPDRATDINDLSDAVLAAGVNLREEEDYLTAAYQNQHQGGSFTSSFNSQSSSTISPQTSFTQWSQGASQLPAFQGAGAVSQKAVTPESMEEELTRKHKSAARALAEHHQHPLGDSFLLLNVVRHKLHKRAYEHGVSLNVDGLFDKIPETPRGVNGVAARAPDGTALASMSAHSLLERNAPLVDVLALLSLAARERVRTVLEDAYTLSRSRQTTATGVVPPDFAEIAVGTGEPKQTTALPTALTGTSWDAADTATSKNGLLKRKRMVSDISGRELITSAGSNHDSGRLPTPPTDPPSTPKPTVSFPKNPLYDALRKLREEEREFEKKRLEMRAKRLRTSTSAGGGAGAEGSAAPSGAATPAPENIAIPAKLTKKERDRLTKLNESAETLHKSANETAAMALGFGKKKYSWMTGGGGRGGGGSGASTPKLNTSVSGKPGATPGGQSPSGPATSSIDPALKTKGRKIGEWREDRREGRGVQIRDVVAALDMDGKERKTLVRILARLKSDD